jgi:hypothetical protein
VSRNPAARDHVGVDRCVPPWAGDPPLAPTKNCAGLMEINLKHAERTGLNDEKDRRIFSKPKPGNGRGSEAHYKFFTGKNA